MKSDKISRLKSVKTFESLVEYLRDELYWPIDVEDAEEITFEYEPNELGIEEKYAVVIKSIKQIRPLADNQPWGIFYIEFERKKLPITVLRKILNALIYMQRRRKDSMKTWNLQDLIFISSLGEIDDRKITFAHFTETEQGLPELRTFSWDKYDTELRYREDVLELDKLHWPENENDIEQWRNQWSSAFIRKHRYVIRTSEELAKKMAVLASRIREQVKEVYSYESKDGPMHNLFENFKKALVHDLTIDTFADMYAQTITYGLFSAKATHEEGFEDGNIVAIIPNTNPFLRNLFRECTKIGEENKYGLDLEELGVIELIETLRETDIEAVLQDFGRRKRREDPVIHFYEDFLREYDPEQKVKRGIFYTPDPVVSFIVRSVDHILRTEFNCPDGLADTSTIPVKYQRKSKRDNNLVEDVKNVPKVQILDPAVGTGTFLKYVIKEIKKTFDEKHNDLSREELKKKWNEYVPKHLLPRLFGFELMMAPYAVCHLKLGLELAETGYDFSSDKRLGVYLTNTLEGTHEGAGTLDSYLDWLATEGRKANAIKEKNCISVIIGNPPYNVNPFSCNNTPYINELMKSYKKGVKEEKYIKPLSDDYIKFIRFSHELIKKNGFGVIGMITNHGYLSGLIHRGMRQEILKFFDKIYVMDLHGNTNIGEKCPDGSADENVFDIMQGVAISIFVKLPCDKNQENAEVYHYDLWGSKKLKNEFLESNDISIMKDRIKPSSPNYFFIKYNTSLIEEYNSYPSIKDIFDLQTIGILTNRDWLVIDFSEEELKRKIYSFFTLIDKPEEMKKTFPKLKNHHWWNFTELKKKISYEEAVSCISKCLFRPFDIRYIVYNPYMLNRDRKQVMNHIYKKDNYVLVASRNSMKKDFNSCFISKYIVEQKAGESTRGSYVFPLFQYKNGIKTLNFTELGNNLAKNFSTGRFVEVGRSFFSYIYAMLYSPSYRTRYCEYLRTDFPHIPITKNLEFFESLSKLGGRLLSIHLLEGNLDISKISFEGEGDYILHEGYPKFKNQEVFINKTQYFDGIPEEIYNFCIGGYQVCQKWLKDRKGRKLTEKDINHYQKIIVAINETIKIMKKIDKTIDEHGGWPIK